MKNTTLSICILMVLQLFFTGCKEDDRKRSILFWTSVDLSNTEYTLLEINGQAIEDFPGSIQNATCDDENTILYAMPTNSIAVLTVRSPEGESLEIGSISLGDFTDGLSVQVSDSNSEASISVEGSSSDPCTLVQLSW